MNAREEMFGFDRLQEIVQDSKSMSADKLLEKIVDGVNAFADGTAQHDDITVIVLGVEN